MSIATALRISPVAARIGASIEGVRLADALDAETIAAIRAALLRHKVIFFRDQGRIGDAEMEGFAEQMGDPIANPLARDPLGSKYLLNLDMAAGHAAGVWHTDMTFMPNYPAASILRPETIPEFGGDTMWANTATAYLDLPEPLRLMADALRGIHSSAVDFDMDFAGDARERVDIYASKKPLAAFETEHPVVRVHPETGERTLVLGNFLKRFAGFNGRQSQQIYALLQEYVMRPENCVRWRWSPGDVAMWDNRATQHRSVADFGDQPRHLRRATIHGDVPVGVDGRESRVISAPGG
ncbi:MAG: TauD/TfdA dioxygenase family protein [Novosphingobium sp.]